MRAWYIKNMSVGLLYQCTLGDLRLDSPVALLQNRRHEGVDFMEVVPMEHQLPAQRDQVTFPLKKTRYHSRPNRPGDSLRKRIERIKPSASDWKADNLPLVHIYLLCPGKQDF